MAEQYNEIWIKYSKACSTGDINTIHYILSNGLLNVNSVDDRGRTGLLMAVPSNQVQVVKYLLSNGADPTLKDINNNTPLHLASIIGSSEIVSTIINFQNQQSHSFNNNNNNNNHNISNQIFSKDINNNTPIHLASSRLKRMLTTIKSKSSNNINTSELINELRSILSSFYAVIDSIGTSEDKLKMQSIINNFENINNNNNHNNNHNNSYNNNNNQESYEMDEDSDFNPSSSNLTKTIDDLDSLLNGLSLS